jgi:hypothetical protein
MGDEFWWYKFVSSPPPPSQLPPSHPAIPNGLTIHPPCNLSTYIEAETHIMFTYFSYFREQ